MYPRYPELKSVFDKSYYYAICGSIVVFSFFNLAPQFTVDFNHNTAVQVLQANDFDFSSDWYFWGQTRLGSILPLFSYFIHTLFGVPAITAVSILNQLSLLGLFLVFAGRLEEDISKISLAFIIFLPATWFGYMVKISHPYALQLLFLGLVMNTASAINDIDCNAKNATKRGTLLLIRAIFFSFMAFWISDYSIIFLSYLFFDLAKRKGKAFVSQSFLNKMFLSLSVALPTIFFAWLILLMKRSVDRPLQSGIDSSFMSFAQFTQTIRTYLADILNVLSFHSNPFLSAAVVSSLICLIYFRDDIFRPKNPLFVLFLLSMFPTIAMHWVWYNKLSCRYFTPAYFFLWMCLIVAADKDPKIRSISRYVVLSICILQSFALIMLERQPSRYKDLAEFRKLGHCGLLGGYMDSYCIAAVSPDSIFASPLPSSAAVRNHKLVDKILAQKTLYVVSDSLPKGFSGIINIFGKSLVRIPDSEISIHNSLLVKYRVLSGSDTLQLNHENMVTVMGKPILVGHEVHWYADEKRAGYVWLGPDLTLDKGKYEVTFLLDAKAHPSTDDYQPLAKIDVWTRQNFVSLGEKLIDPTNSKESHYAIPLDLKSQCSFLEFRIYKYPNSAVKIKGIIICRKNEI